MKDKAIEAVKKASQIVKRRFGTVFEVKAKGGNPKDLVTEVDLAAEKIIFDTLRSAYPDHGFFSEEAGKSEINAEYVWMIDPLDGTTNFAHGIPCVSVSIALIKDK